MKNKFKQLIFLTIIIILSYFIIESSMGNSNFKFFFFRLITYKRISLISLTFLSLVMLFYLALLNNIISASLIYLLTMISFSVANGQKILMRGEPLFPHDLKETVNIVDLFKMMSLNDKLISLITVTIIIFMILVLNRISFKTIKIQLFSTKTPRIISLIASIVCLFLYWGINSFNQPLSDILSNSGFVYSRWDPMKTYRENGVVISFIKNFPGVSMNKPEGYDLDSMNHISKQYISLANDINRNRSRNNFEDINVVYILSESLADPSRISQIELSETPLTYIQDESDKNAVGLLLSKEFGGGTANVEFEILTSLSTSHLLPNMSLPYQDILSYKNNFPSMARASKSAGRVSIAMHSFHSKFYQRRKVFKNLGFDNMFFEDDFNNKMSLEGGRYISDTSSYEEILEMLTQQDPLFMHFITMQNHTPYNDIYDEYKIEVLSDIQEDIDRIKIYTEGIRQTDLSTEDFINKLKTFDEKTIVVFYGDHLPPIYSNHLTEHDYLSKHLTDFFIYSNFSEEKIILDSITPTYYINNLVYELADVKVTPFLAFIEKFNEEFSGMLKNEFITKSGSMLTYEELSDYQKELVDHYVLIQYDIIEGNCYFAEMCN